MAETVFGKPVDNAIKENTAAITQLENKLHTLYEVLYHTSSTTLAYTGVSVTIPAHCAYAVSGYGIYNNGAPIEIAISTDTDSGHTYNFMAHDVISSTGVGGVSCVGYTENNPVTLYLHVRRTVAGSNQDGLKGWYIEL